jgi:hypothetical protein
VEDHYIWILTDSISATADEVVTAAHLCNIEVTWIGLSLQGRSKSMTDLESFKKAITYLQYSKDQQPEDDGDV